ncbi:MAG TPA: hypothetical protein VNY04_10200, partial [Chthoniobacterales bacterium]|nr:hypothetical protein [Chthoniobacterales bacterium]
VHRSPFAVRRSPFTVRRSPFAVRRSPAQSQQAAPTVLVLVLVLEVTVSPVLGSPFAVRPSQGANRTRPRRRTRIRYATTDANHL